MSAFFTPLLDTMSVAARTAWPFIQSAVEKGLGSEEVIAALREGGIPTFRRQDMLALIREASGAQLLKSDIQRWPSDVLLPLDRVRESVTKIVAPFSYTLRVTVRDLETGEESVITRQAHSQTLRPTADVASDFANEAPAFEQYQGLEVVGAEVLDIQRSGALGVI